MLPIALRFVLIALVTAAATVSAAPGLGLKLSGPNKVNGVDNLKIVATFINTGNEPLKLLNDPRGPLSKMPTQTFLVSHDESGAAPAFTGVKVKYVPSYAAKFGGVDAFTVLAPGGSTSIEHDLSKTYNFTNSGPGTYSFNIASDQFHYVNDAGEPIAISAIRPAVHRTSLSGKLASPRHTLPRRATYNGCSSSQQTALVAAAAAAQNYASSTHAYTQSHTPVSVRYTMWFGIFSMPRHDIVDFHFSKLNSNSYANYTYDCTCTDPDTFAYVFPDDFGKVFLCGAFWEAPVTGSDSQGGTLIHESSHFTANGGTEDYVYGQAQSQVLALDDPNDAVHNADNHEYYAENNPSLV